MLNNIKIICYITIGSILGVFFSNYEYFKLVEELNLGDILGLIITSLVGLYIADTIQKNHTSHTKEKEFIIDEIKQIREHLAFLKKGSDSGSFPFNETISTLKDLNTKLLYIKQLFEMSPLCKKMDLKKIHAEFRTVRNLISGISPNSGLITIEPRIKSNIERRLNAINKLVFTLILEVNKA